MFHLPIETPRLTLRRWAPSDAPALATILGDPEVMAFSDHGPLDDARQEAWLGAARAVAFPSLCLAMQEKSAARVIGYVRLSTDPHRVPSGTAELGFRLARSMRGPGYATDAVRATTQSARHLEGVKRLAAIVDPHNLRSIRVLDKVGFSREGEISFEGYDYPDHLYALTL